MRRQFSIYFMISNPKCRFFLIRTIKTLNIRKFDKINDTVIQQICHHKPTKPCQSGSRHLCKITKPLSSKSGLKPGSLGLPGSGLLPITLFCWLVNEWMINHLTVSQDLVSSKWYSVSYMSQLQSYLPYSLNMCPIH